MDGIDISLVKTNGVILKRLNKNFITDIVQKQKNSRGYIKKDININLKKSVF